jgi:hypothetical protein
MPTTPQSKADFVRSLSKTMPATLVIERGKAAGVQLSKNYVYRVRSWANAAKSQNKKAPKTTPTATKSAAATLDSSAERLLKAVAAEIGLGRAVEILSGERARVRAVIGG